MGCDGGTIPRRDELVRLKKKPEQVDKDAENVAKWKHCALSQEELKSPIVACDLGRLYNKDSVIEYLLDKSQGTEIAEHIRNLKDIIVLNLTENPTDKTSEDTKGDAYIDHQASKYICPVVGMEMNGKYKFCYLRGCGCVISERALKQVKCENCHKCGKKFTDDDIIVLNGTNVEVEDLRQNMEERRLKQKMEKKLKKHKLESAVAGSSTEAKKVKFDASTKSMPTTKPATTAMRSGINRNGVKSQDTSSIATDSSKTEVFKSLFTSHKTYTDQPKAHWVTYNPLYN